MNMKQKKKQAMQALLNKIKNIEKYINANRHIFTTSEGLENKKPR